MTSESGTQIENSSLDDMKKENEELKRVNEQLMGQIKELRRINDAISTDIMPPKAWRPS